MILDTQTTFADGQAVTSTAISENVIDLNPMGGPNATQNIGIGEHTYLLVETDVTCTDSGSDATLTVTLESDDAADLAGSATVHYSSGALAFADFATAGTRLVAVRLPEQDTYQRYVGVRFTVASGPLTAGAFNAYLAKDIPNNVTYAKNYAV